MIFISKYVEDLFFFFIILSLQTFKITEVLSWKTFTKNYIW